MALRRMFGFSEGELMRSDCKPCSRLMRQTAGIFSVGGAFGFWILCRLHYGMFYYPYYVGRWYLLCFGIMPLMLLNDLTACVHHLAFGYICHVTDRKGHIRGGYIKLVLCIVGGGLKLSGLPDKAKHFVSKISLRIDILT